MPQDTPWFKDVITLEIPSVWSDELLESLQTTVLPEYFRFADGLAKSSGL